MTMSNNSIFAFLAGAAIGAGAMWLAKADKEKVNAILDKIDKKLSTEKETESTADGTTE